MNKQDLFTQKIFNHFSLHPSRQKNLCVIRITWVQVYLANVHYELGDYEKCKKLLEVRQAKLGVSSG